MARMTLLAVSVAVLACAGAAQAAFLCNWNDANVIHLSDPLDAPDPAFDLTDVYFLEQGGVHYYRLDLAAASSPAPVYGFLWDNGPGGISGSGAPPEVLGADSFLFRQGPVGGFYLSGTFYPATMQATENSGLSIEWAIAAGLQDPGGGRAAVYLPTYETWYDLSDPLPEVPEPGSVALLGVGLVGLVCRLRRGRRAPAEQAREDQ